MTQAKKANGGNPVTDSVTTTTPPLIAEAAASISTLSVQPDADVSTLSMQGGADVAPRNNSSSSSMAREPETAAVCGKSSNGPLCLGAEVLGFRGSPSIGVEYSTQGAPKQSPYDCSHMAMTYTALAILATLTEPAPTHGTATGSAAGNAAGSLPDVRQHPAEESSRGGAGLLGEQVDERSSEGVGARGEDGNGVLDRWEDGVCARGGDGVDATAACNRVGEVRGMAKSLRELQLQDGSFMPVACGSESDMRFVFCAAAISSMIGDWRGVDIPRAVAYIQRSQSFDGGFGLGPGFEAHGGATYCAVAALQLIASSTSELLSSAAATAAASASSLLSSSGAAAAAAAAAVSSPGAKTAASSSLPTASPVTSSGASLAASAAAAPLAVAAELSHFPLPLSPLLQLLSTPVAGSRSESNAAAGAQEEAEAAGVQAAAEEETSSSLFSSPYVLPLIDWCLQRQGAEGGFQGRRNKPADTCYAFWWALPLPAAAFLLHPWVGGTLSMRERIHLIDHARGTLVNLCSYCHSPPTYVPSLPSYPSLSDPWIPGVGGTLSMLGADHLVDRARGTLVTLCSYCRFPTHFRALPPFLSLSLSPRVGGTLSMLGADHSHAQGTLVSLCSYRHSPPTPIPSPSLSPRVGGILSMLGADHSHARGALVTLCSCPHLPPTPMPSLSLTHTGVGGTLSMLAADFSRPAHAAVHHPLPCPPSLSHTQGMVGAAASIQWDSLTSSIPSTGSVGSAPLDPPLPHPSLSPTTEAPHQSPCFPCPPIPLSMRIQCATIEACCLPPAQQRPNRRFRHGRDPPAAPQTADPRKIPLLRICSPKPPVRPARATTTPLSRAIAAPRVAAIAAAAAPLPCARSPRALERALPRRRNWRRAFMPLPLAVPLTLRRKGDAPQLRSVERARAPRCRARTLCSYERALRSRAHPRTRHRCPPPWRPSPF
ncbi:unnamed protein product [Closterium sp. Naga37s-1]|nr:unnamed protein product [Closterium sp. Naga37s-1]